MPKLSIIVPVYNVEQYIERCVNSILHQTFQDFKLILIDDGSTDKSGAICDTFTARDNRVIVCHKTNEGVASARNKGVELADTEWIGFVDSDDEIHPNMYEKLMQLAEEKEADVVNCSCTIIKNDEQVNVQDIWCGDEYKILEGRSIVEWYIKKNEGFTLWNKVYRRKLFNDIEFPNGKIAEDIFTVYKILNLCKRVIVLDCPYYYYRIRMDSITKQGFTISRWDNVEAHEEVLRFISAWYPEYRKYALRRYIYVALGVVNGHIGSGYSPKSQRFERVFTILRKNILIILNMKVFSVKEKLASIPIVLGKGVYCLWVKGISKAKLKKKT